MKSTLSRALGLPALGLVILGLAGCGDDRSADAAAAGDTPPSVARTAPPSSPSSSVDDGFEASFRAVAENDLRPLRRAQRRAAPGSVARAYFTNQADQVQANLVGDDDATSGTLSRVEGGYRLCYPGDDVATCYTYASLAVRRGALAAFTVNGRSLRGRLALGNGTVVRSALADVTLRSAYLAADGSLVTVLTVHAKQGIQIDGRTSYRAPGGSARQFSSSSGLDELPGGSTGWVYFRFAGPLEFGGTVDLVVFPSEGSGSEAVAAVPIG